MDSFTFFVVTDTHYYEASLGAWGSEYDKRMKTEQKLFRENGEVVHATFLKLCENKDINTVIIAGDVTQNGEYESHVSFIKDLEMLKAAGKRILLITAVHDYNDAPDAYIGDKLVKVKGTKRTELREMYNDYGFSEALAIDEKTYTYVAQLCDGVRLLAINCDGGEIRGGVEGVITDEQKEWIREQVEAAHAAGDKVIAMEHYPLVPQAPIFGIIRNCVLHDWQDRASFLADLGVHLIFTGHMHAQSIKRFTNANGNSIIDCQTSAVIGYPAKYRTCTITGNKVEMKCFDVPDFTMTDGTVIDKAYFKRQFSQMVPNRLGEMLKEGRDDQTSVQKLLLEFVRSLTIGKAERLIFLKADKSLKDLKVTDFAEKLVMPLFEGDIDYKPGTPVYDDLAKVFKRLSPVIKKLNAKLSKNGNEVDLEELVLSSLYRKDELSDNDCTFEI